MRSQLRDTTVWITKIDTRHLMHHDNLHWLPAATDQAERKVQRLAERVGGTFLHATRNGRYNPVDAAWWTSGFWPGMLWLIQRRTPTPDLARMATAAEDELTRTIIDARFDELNHDVGFQFQPTAVMRAKLTGNPAARRRGIVAAALLMSRFNLAGNFIEAWNGAAPRGMAIIDTLMNLPLLFWAADATNQPRYRHVADAHAQMAQRHFVRSDGTTHHIVRFDQTTGAPVEPLGGQGYAADSCWSRGQAWALYGFTIAARYTRNESYLHTARRVADSFIAALPPEQIPPWDFRAPDTASAPRDSSAAAIATSGLLDLAALLGAVGAHYRQAALDLLHALHSRCAAPDDHDALLLHATGNLPANRDIDVALIYGDYYYLEALQKLHGISETCW
jgi:unsaturated chondroitin disaccharide hydrolase